MLLATLAALATPASATAAIQVVVTAYPLPSAAPTAAILVTGQSDGEQATATFEPNGPGESDDRLRITSTSGDLVDNNGGDACTRDPDAMGDLRTMVCRTSEVSPYWIIEGNGGGDELRVDGPAQPDGYEVWISGGEGDDLLVAGAGAQLLYGDGFTDGGASCDDAPGPAVAPAVDCNDVIHDGLGRDVVRGGGGSDTLVQSALGNVGPDQDRDDVDLGSGGGDTVTWSGRGASEPVTVRAPGSGPAAGSGTSFEYDTIADGIERFVGTPGNDSFEPAPSVASRTFEGGAGDDTFRPSTSAEMLVGGAGTDSVRWDTPAIFPSGVTSTANGVADDGPAGLHHVDSDIERMYGSAGPDVLLGAAVEGCRISGGGGADTVTAPATGCILEGGDGADTIAGGAGADVVRPGGSSTTTPDTITFGGGSDTIDYHGGMLIGGASAIIGVQASAAHGATAWCHGLGIGTTSARKFVGGAAHLETWAEAPEQVVATIASDTLCAGPVAMRLDGGEGADVLIGHHGADVLVGGSGNDTLNGLGGNDVLDGGIGDDNLNGGAGSDVVDGGDGNDRVRGGGGSDTIRGGAGNDTLDEIAFSAILPGQPATELDGPDLLDGGPGADVLDGNAGDDVIACMPDLLADQVSDSGGGVEVLDCSGIGGPIAMAVGGGIDRIVGTPFGDVLSGATDLVGGGGNDTLTGAGGGTLDGGDGDDRLAQAGGALLGGPGNDVLDGPGAARLEGGPGNDLVRGGAAAETLDGGPGDDRLEGGEGDDVLEGGPGADTLRGGGGFDTVSYASRGGGVEVSRGGGADDGQPGERDDVGADVELVIGTGGSDTLSAGDSPAILRGEGGNDVLVGSPGTDELDGGSGNDRLVGGDGVDALRGGDANDTLLGGGGNDRLFGEDGADTLDGGFGRDLLSGGAGTDAVTYATRRVPVIVTIGTKRADDGQRNERDRVLPDVENAVGGRGDDRLVGNGGRNLLRGGPGRDRLEGGSGNDRLFGGPGNDHLVGAAGNDQLRGEAGNDVLDARDLRPASHRRFRELVDGGAGRDTVYRDARDRLLRVELRRKAPPRKLKRRPASRR